MSRLFQVWYKYQVPGIADGVDGAVIIRAKSIDDALLKFNAHMIHTKGVNPTHFVSLQVRLVDDNYLD